MICEIELVKRLLLSLIFYLIYSMISLINKIIIHKKSLKKLCIDMIIFSFKSISDINYMKLNSISFRLIGCYNNHTLIARLLLNKKIINQQMYIILKI